MNRRLVKEFRSLLLPWSIAVVAGAVLAIKLMIDPAAIESFDVASGSWTTDPFESTLARTAGFAFFGTLVIACALSFGTELQQRTLPLLLAQPLSRARLWNEKLLVLAAAVVSAVSIHCLVQLLVLASVPFVQPHLDLTPQQMLLAGTFLLATVCSAGFWTLLARSTIGGMAFGMSAPLLLGLGAAFIAERMSGPYVIRFGDSKSSPAIIIAWLIYSPTFLWLGWRMFARLEVKGAAFEGSGAFPFAEPHPGGKWWSDWLRSRPTGGLLNLVRKELRLQRPVFQVAAVFTVCWLITIVLLVLEPARQPMFETILNIPMGFYVPLSMLLAGCVSLGEEKTLGLTTWHLTLPISARRQWLVKLSVSAAVGLILGWGLPYLLAWITSPKANVGLLAPIYRGGWQMLLLVSALVFVMSFWAVTMLGNAIKAALATVISLVGLLFCGLFGAWCGGKLFGLEAPLLTGITAHFQLAPDFFTSAFNPFNVPLFFAILILAALVQSRAQFRRIQPHSLTVVKYSLILGAITFLVAFWFADFAVSAGEQRNSRLVWEVKHALQSLPAEEGLVPWHHSRDVTPQELAKTGKLSRTTRIWLRDAWITLNPPPNGSRVTVHQGDRTKDRVVCPVTLNFPNGTHFSFYYELPQGPAK